ncbi:MAG: hypothetical protein M5U26_13275 [Planctomycetota bacterium]|nr:hypothetical protein [Planctomycetota bacterium]
MSKKTKRRATSQEGESPERPSILVALDRIKDRWTKPYQKLLQEIFEESMKHDAGYSPELMALALQLAFLSILDRRRPNKDDVFRYRVTRRGSRYLVSEHTNSFFAQHVPEESHVEIFESTAVRVLDCIVPDQRRLDELRNVIQRRLGKDLGHECPAEKLRFEFEIEEISDGSCVHLWIDGSEVALPRSADVHRLLENLCSKPKLRMNKSAAEKRYQITNVYRAWKGIRASLGAARKGAEAWVLEREIGWVKGCAPSRKKRRGQST